MATTARCLALLLALAGCGRIGFNGSADGGAGDGALDDSAMDLQCTTETYAGGVPPGWAPWSDTAGFTASVVNGEVVIQLQPLANGYAGLNSDTMIDFTRSSVTIAVNAVVATPSAEQWFTLYIDNNNTYDFRYENGLLYMARRLAGVITETNIVYSATDHRSWRIAHDADANMVTWSTSDGLTWTQRYQLPATVPTTALTMELSAGTFGGGTAQPGTPRFDNFVLCRP
jgi:hypothetical protein